MTEDRRARILAIAIVVLSATGGGAIVGVIASMYDTPTEIVLIIVGAIGIGLGMRIRFGET